MAKSIIVEGKTTAEAIEKGLKELKVTKNMVDIKPVEDEKKRSFYSILAPRVVKIEMTIKENVEPEKTYVPKERKNVNKDLNEIEKVSNILKEFFNKILDKDIKCEIKIENYDIIVNISGEKAAGFIGYRGATINAMQTLATAIANKNSSAKIRIIVDVENYREKRKETLEELAEKISKAVVKTRKSITLEPMTAYERKVIHSKIQENDKVKTFSIGEEPHRRVVIALK